MSRLLLALANARQIPLRDKSIHMVCTSPPYLGLRQYQGIEPTIWGGDPACMHTWGDEHRITRSSGGERIYGSSDGHVGRGQAPTLSPWACCSLCGAWWGTLGNEDMPDCLAWARGEPACSSCYTCHLRIVAAEIWRVLRDDGTLWLNIADSYSSGGRGTSVHHQKKLGFATAAAQALGKKFTPGFKPKNLLGIPWRIALALQQDGWVLRSDIIWAKPNAMPESVRDRPSRAHEHIFLFAKYPRYFFDQEAIREDYSAKGLNDAAHAYGYGTGSKMHKAITEGLHGAGGLNDPSMTRDAFYQHGGRNARDVWTFPTQSFAGEHYAAFPQELARRCILAGTSAMGCCPQCAAPYVRQVDHQRLLDGHLPVTGTFSRPGEPFRIPANGKGHWLYTTQTVEQGWVPGCVCAAGDPRPCVVLDPFTGSSTTLLVARTLGRHAVGVDLSWTYLHNVSRQRLGLTSLAAWEGRDEYHHTDEPYDSLPLFAHGCQEEAQ